jgi:hypothetical protein
MTTQEKTLNEQLREVAQKLVDLEINRKDIVSEMTELKENFEQLVEEGSDTSVDVNGGMVFIQDTIQYKIPEGLIQETEVKTKDASKLNPELLKQYFDPALKLSKSAVKALKNSSDVDLAKLVVQEEKSKVSIKV